MNRRTAMSLTASAAAAAAALLLGAGSGGAVAAPAESPVCLQINIVDAYDTGALLCPDGQ